MSSEVLHKDKYLHNKEFVENEIKNQEKYIDWTITAMFYCAVHLVEMKLAQSGIHRDCHLDRNDDVRKRPEFANCSCEYLHMYSKSQMARYECIAPRRDDLVACQQNLKHIEDCLLPKGKK